MSTIENLSPIEFMLLINGAALALYVLLVVGFSLLPHRIRLTVIERKPDDDR